jgi:hypothetical protein|tara:strand:- start:284 stop:463 length:180 start_codon:yes stop_codon:yes gene_type:complete
MEPNQKAEIAKELQCDILTEAINLVRADDDGCSVDWHDVVYELLYSTREYMKLIGEYDG